MADVLNQPNIARQLADPLQRAQYFKRLLEKCGKLVIEGEHFNETAYSEEELSGYHKRLLEAMALRDAIVSDMPSEMRESLGGYASLSILKTGAARKAYVIRESQTLCAAVLSWAEELGVLKPEPNRDWIPAAICSVAAIGFGVIAFERIETATFQLSHWALSVASAVLAWRFLQQGNRVMAVVTGAFAVASNQIAPIKFSHYDWGAVNGWTAGYCGLLAVVAMGWVPKLGRFPGFFSRSPDNQ